MTNETEKKITPAITRKVEANEATYRETMREPHARYVAARNKAQADYDAAIAGKEDDADAVTAAEQARDLAVREEHLRLKAIDNEAQEVRRIADLEAWEA